MNNPRDLNWPIIFTWLILTIIGLTAIFSATQGPVSEFLPSYIQSNFYKQLGFVVVGFLVMIGVQFVSPRTFQQLSYLIYILALLLMILTLLFGKEVNGAKSWFNIGPFGIQSSEFMKIATILAVANYLTSRRNISAENIRYALITVVIILIPTALVIAQNDFGTAIIFLALIPVMLFWSGLPYGVSLFIISPAIILYLTVLSWQIGVAA
ncbi:MAG: FtsW/RodA/SpoVE family cell cycle protein, partial [Balneolales bacterium]|nr:FtsW/RodA/SpoVE family cell cycle protein [Balneolales bacterium]